MSDDRLLGGHGYPYTVGGLTFRCWVTAAGDNELGLPARRQEWRSTCGRARCARGGRHYWANVRGVGEIGTGYKSLLSAMLAAAAAVGQGKAAA